MIGNLSRVQKIYLVTGRTDMRKSFDGLMAVIRDNFQMDPFSNAVFLFCGRKKNTMKALYFDRDGFVLLQKRLDVFCKHFLDKVAKHFWTLLQVQIGQSCKASTGSYPASRIAIADHI